MRYPVSDPYQITDVFGANQSWRSFPHTGVDFAFYAGDGQVYAPHAGTIVAAGYNSARGNYIELRSRAGMYVSHFYHLAKDKVYIGQTVKEGEHLGTMGLTGNVTGAHLHWSLFRLNKLVDPLKYSKPPKEAEMLFGKDIKYFYERAKKYRSERDHYKERAIHYRARTIEEKAKVTALSKELEACGVDPDEVVVKKSLIQSIKDAVNKIGEL